MCSAQTQDLAEGKTDVCKEFRFVVQDAFTALYDLRSRNAEQAFSQALALLETKTRKVVASHLPQFPTFCKQV